MKLKFTAYNYRGVVISICCVGVTVIMNVHAYDREGGMNGVGKSCRH